MNTSARMNMLKLLFLKLVGRSVCLDVRHFITSHSANTIFISMIKPTLEYSAGVWACCGEVNSKILEALQKRVGRIVHLIKTFTSDTAMEALKWPSLRSKRNEHIHKLVRKCIDCWCPQYFKNYFVFNKDICACSTCQSNLLRCLLFFL